MKRILVLALSVLMLWACAKDTVVSPSGDISVRMDAGAMEISYRGVPVQTVRIALGDLVSSSKVSRIEESYDMLIGKRLHCTNSANARTFSYEGTDIEVRAYNDGVAYRFTGLHPDVEYVIPQGRNRWLLRSKADYEALYPLTDGASSGDWFYPALLEYGEGVFGLLTESGVYRGQCGSFLRSADGDENYRLVPADLTFPEGTSPWRLVILGELSDIVESTLVTDVAEPCRLEDTSWIKPGVSAWIYWSSNHGSNDFAQVKDFIDLADEMGWPYNLIDAEWDVMTNGGTIEDAVTYANEKGIRTNVWYNSGTSWIGQGAPGPLFLMLDPQVREAEMTRIENMGVTGVKIDFFKDDGSESIAYYMDLLEDAARHHLLVDFHGCTLPRGWERTYPNLMSMEAVFGAEWYNNVPFYTPLAAAHNATLPFTRNVVGPMDYTPGTFSDSQHPHITTWGHELALTVLFESGLQHMPDRPSIYYGFEKQVKDLLSNLPNTWDDTRLLSGYPGDHVVIARRKGDRWYVAGINGTENSGELVFDLSELGLSGCRATFFVDSEDGDSIEVCTSEELFHSLECLPRGGFLAVVEQ